MGSADVVPGVSGGTIALVLRVYERLVKAVATITTKEPWRLLLKGKIIAWWNALDATFLLSLGVGILVAIATLAGMLEELLASHPRHLAAFFFGLVAASSLFVGWRVSHWNALRVALFLAGAMLAAFIVLLAPVSTPETWWFYMLSGAIAICAMVLPGISGSYILLLLGKYESILSAVHDRDIGIILLVGTGVVIGILLFTKLLAYLLVRIHDSMMAVLAGLVVGSLLKLWPWSDRVFESQAVSESITAFTGVVLILAGMILVIVLERIGASAQRRASR